MDGEEPSILSGRTYSLNDDVNVYGRSYIYNLVQIILRRRVFESIHIDTKEPDVSLVKFE
jgi:hypothetical protein